MPTICHTPAKSAVLENPWSKFNLYVNRKQRSSFWEWANLENWEIRFENALHRPTETLEGKKASFLSYIWEDGYLGRDADGLAGDGGPPDHQVGVQGDPDDASEEGYGEELSCWKREG